MDLGDSYQADRARLDRFKHSVPAAAVSEDYPLFDTLETMRAALIEDSKNDEWGTYGGHIDMDFGSTLDVVYGEDDEGQYALIGFLLPDGFYVEHENGYAGLTGFRIYRDYL